MPQWIELYQSGEGVENIANPSATSATRVFAVTGIHDELIVRQYIESNLPSIYLELNLSDYHPRPLGNGLWNVTATYGAQQLTNLGDVATSFDTTGGTRHITQSLATVGAYGNGALVTDFMGAINVDSSGVKGCDIPGPGTFKFSISKKWPVAFFDQTQIVALAAMTFRTNTDLFYGFAPGTLLFLGASGSQQGVKSWDVTYQFAFSENVTNLTVGGITGINKKGWEYLWFVYRKFEVNSHVVQRPWRGYVERVCETASFSTLGA